MIRYLALLSVVAIIGLVAAARFGDLRPDARLHPAPWALDWQAGQPHVLFLTGEDGAELRLGSRAFGLQDIGVVDSESQLKVLASAEGCPGSVYTAEDPGQTIWLPPGSAVETVACPNRPAEAALTVELFTRTGDAGRNIVTYFLKVTDSGPQINAPQDGATFPGPYQDGDTVTTVQADDADGDTITYQVSPSGFSLGPDGVLRIEGAAAGDHEVTLTAASGLESQSIRITVTVQ